MRSPLFADYIPIFRITIEPRFYAKQCCRLTQCLFGSYASRRGSSLLTAKDAARSWQTLLGLVGVLAPVKGERGCAGVALVVDHRIAIVVSVDPGSHGRREMPVSAGLGR